MTRERSRRGIFREPVGRQLDTDVYHFPSTGNIPTGLRVYGQLSSTESGLSTDRNTSNDDLISSRPDNHPSVDSLSRNRAENLTIRGYFSRDPFLVQRFQPPQRSQLQEVSDYPSSEPSYQQTDLAGSHYSQTSFNGSPEFVVHRNDCNQFSLGPGLVCAPDCMAAGVPTVETVAADSRPENVEPLSSVCPASVDAPQYAPHYLSAAYPAPVPRTRRNRRHRRHRRRSRSHRHNSRHRRHGPPQTDDDDYVKPCCSRLGCKICLSVCLQFQKVLIFFASFGIVCVLIGIILGVLRTPGNSFFTLSLMFVGLGLILLAMVLVGWKCTPADHEPCHMLFGLGVYSTVGRRDRRRRERLYWLGGMLYPEFRNRRPPPSYSAAMQDCRNEMRPTYYMPGSPPPSYKSHSSVQRPGIHIIFPRGDDYPTSNPPTYRIAHSANRPSILIQNESNFTDISPVPYNRDSTSSTQMLVSSDYNDQTNYSTTGCVNLSFHPPDNCDTQDDAVVCSDHLDSNSSASNAAEVDNCVVITIDNRASV